MLTRWPALLDAGGSEVLEQVGRAGSSALEGRGWPQVWLINRSPRESERVVGGLRRSPPSDVLVELGEPTRSQVEPATTLSVSLQQTGFDQLPKVAVRNLLGGSTDRRVVAEGSRDRSFLS